MESKEIKKATAELSEIAQIKTSLLEAYNGILECIDYYIDTTPENKCILALWILGTHFYKKFPTFPILFFNAMRGSGKTRALNLTSHLSYGFIGNVQNSISQSVLFHSEKPLFLDEVEKLHRSDLNDLQTLLNSCYKKGAKVSRMGKVKKEDKEVYESQEFDLYKPVAMANINGLDSVLENRAIILFLDKSFNKAITSRLEDFDIRLKSLKDKLKHLSDKIDANDTHDTMTGVTQVLDIEGVINGWNDYVDSLSCASQVSKASWCHQIYEKIYNAGISGRTLELCFPLLIMASFVSDEVFRQALEVFSKITKRHREVELDDTHVLIYRFISTKPESLDFEPVSRLFNEFQTFCSIPTSLNNTSFSMALERLSLIKERKRTAHSRLIKLDVQKAKQKIGLFDKEATP